MGDRDTLEPEDFPRITYGDRGDLTAEQHRDRTGHTVMITAEDKKPDTCWDCEWTSAAPEPARPVEDREPVGPYAPTRAEPIPVPEEIEARILADQQQYKSGFRAGVKVGAAEQEARMLDRPFVETVTELPSAYDVAERALDYASRLVKPVDGGLLADREVAQGLADQQARFAIMVADPLYWWLWQFTDMDGPERAIVETCGSCSQPRERHDPGCLYAPRESLGDPWGTAPDKVTVTMSQGGFAPSSETIKQAVLNAIAERNAEPVEDVGKPMAPEDLPCPECRQGKHDNCPGRVLDEAATDDTGVPTYLGCPCAVDTHPESLG